MARSNDEIEQNTASSPLPSDRTCLLVVGMHRSGTSALARVLSLLGADLPRTLMQGTEAHKVSNTTGHWESEVAAKLGDQILDSAGTDWRSPEPVAASWYRSARYGHMRDRAVALLEAEFGDSRLFVFKDPRVSKLLPFWLDVLDHTGTRAKIVTIVRSPLEVALSLQARNGFHGSIGQLLWLRYVLDGEAASRAAPRIFVTYDQLLNNTDEVIERIGTSLNVIWPRASFKTAATITDFLSPEHRHHSRDLPLTPTVQRGLTPLLGNVYAVLTRWAAEGETPSDRPLLDRSREELDRALTLLGEPLRQAVDQGSQIRRLEGEREAHRLSLQEQKRAVADVVRAQVKAEEDHARARTEIERLRRKAAELETSRAEAFRRNQESQAALTKAEKQLLAAEAARNEARLATVEKELKAQHHAAAMKLKLAQQTHIASDRQAAIEHLRQDRARKVAERDKHNEELRTRLQALQRQIVLAQTEKERRTRANTLRARAARLLGLPSAAAAKARASQLAMLQASELFDPWWYLEKYEDVRQQGLEPAEHYLDHGGPEGRSPGPGFDARYYLDANPDVRIANINPLLHYIEHGQLEGRDIRPVGNGKRQGALPRGPGTSPLARAFAPKADAAQKHGAMRKSAATDASPAFIPFRPARIENVDAGDWRARALSFCSLARFANVERGTSSGSPSDGATGGDLRDEAALAWMAVLGPTGARPPEQPAVAALRRQLCGGKLAMADAWFETPGELRLRFQADPGGKRLILRAFQHEGQGGLSQCGEAALTTGGQVILNVRMISPYRPLLLVANDPAGPADSTLLPFPSLCRGGPHFGELGSSPKADSALEAAYDLSSRLLAKLSAVASGDMSFALSNIVIDIAAANGTEPALASDLLAWLIRDLGLTVTAGNRADSDPAGAALRADMASLGPPSAPRAVTACLDLPATGIPTLAVLFALAGELAEGMCQSIHMHPVEGLAAYSLTFRSVGLTARPVLIPGIEGSAMLRGGKRDGGATVPLAIHWPSPAPAAPRAFFPVSAGVPIAVRPEKVANPSLSVLIDCPAGGADLEPLLLSVARLRVNFDLDCVLVINPHDPAAIAVPSDLGMDVRRLESATPTRIQRLVEASDGSRFERLLLLDPSIVLHDLRIGAAMWEALDAPGTGSVSCALVCEAAGTKGVVQLHRTAGWIVMTDADGRTKVAKPDLANHALPPLVPIVAPDLRCTMIDRATLQKAGGDADHEPALGLALAGCGLPSLCLTFVTATSNELDVMEGWDIPETPERALNLRSLR